MSNTSSFEQNDVGIRILVEGRRDQEFFEAMVKHLSINNAHVINYNGIDNLKNDLPRLKRSRNFKKMTSIGIVRDANGSFERAFQSVQNSLRNAGFPVPERAWEKSGSNPSVSVLILPDNESNGTLETLLWKTVDDEKTRKCIDEYIDCVEKIPNTPAKSEAWRDKARAYSYIATRERPDISLRTSFEKDHWVLDHDALSIVREFIRDLGNTS